MTSKELWNNLHLVIQDDSKEFDALYDEWKRVYDGIVNMFFRTEDKEILAIGDNNENCFCCFVNGRLAPLIWDGFSVQDPKLPSRDAKKYLDESSELYLDEETVSFIRCHHDIALLSFQAGAYLSSLENPKIGSVRYQA